MAWVRLDDGYPEHPKVDRVGPMAAWLNVCAWAYCARNLTDGFVPAERAARLADVPNAKKLVTALVEANLWETVEGGYRVHDYLAYNPSRETVLKERSATAKRVSEWREKHGSNGVTPGESYGVGNPVTNGVTNGVSTPRPVNVPYTSPPGDEREKTNPPAPTGQPPADFRQGPKLMKPGNPRVAAVIDAFRALKIEPTISSRDAAAIKNSNADPAKIAEVYDAVARCEYGDDFMRRRLSIHEAIDWINGYFEWKAEEQWRASNEPA